MLCKGLLPVSTLHQIISTITLISYTKKDLENICDEIFYHFLCGKLGNKVLNKIISIINNDPNNSRITGAINLINRVIWSNNSMSTYFYIENIFLKSMSECFKPISMEIVYSIIKATKRIVQTRKYQMISGSWNEVLNIAEKTAKVLKNESSNQLRVQISYELHELVNLIENIVSKHSIRETNLAIIDIKKFFDIVESVIDHRPESSVFRLISYKINSISQSISWCLELKTIIKKYLECNNSIKIQSYIFEKISEVLKIRVGTYANDVVDLCVNFNFDFENRPESVQQQIVILIFDLLVVLDGNERKKLNDLLKAYITSSFNCNSCYSYIMCVEFITILYKSPFPKFLNKPDDEEVCNIMSYLFIFLDNVYKLKNHNPKALTQLNNSIKSSISALVAISNYFDEFSCSYDKNEVMANNDNCFTTIENFNEIASEISSDKDLFSSNDFSIHGSGHFIKDEIFGLIDENDKKNNFKKNDKHYNNLSDNDIQTRYDIDLQSVKSSTYANYFFQCLIKIMNNETESDVLYYIIEDLINLLYQSCLVKRANKGILNEVVVTIVQLFERAITNDISGLCEGCTIETLSKDNKLENISTNSSNFSNLQLKIIAFLQNTTVYSDLLFPSTQRAILKLFQSGMKAKTFHYCIIALTSCLPEFEPTGQVRVVKAILIKLSQMTSTKTTATFVLQFLSTLSQIPLLWRDFSEYDYKNIFAISFQHFNSKKFPDHITSFAQYVICSWFVKCRDTLKSEFIHHITRIFQSAELKVNEKSTQNNLVETCLDMMACNMHTSNVQGGSPNRCEDFDKTSSCTWLMGNRLVTISTQQQSSHGNFINGATKNEEEHSFASIEIRRPCGHTCWNISSMNLQSFQLAKKIDATEISKSSNIVAEESSRKRSSTISTSNEYQQRKKLPSSASFNKQFHQSSISPEQVFLHFFYTSISNNSENRPLLIPNSRHLESSLRMLDITPAYDTWATGVCYVRNNQYSDQTGIILNQYGSTLYQNFIASLGDLVNINDCDERRTYLGGLDHKHGKDGNYTYIWRERTMQMVFHITTLMPNKSSGRISEKTRHLGNNFVLIVYDDSCKYVPHTVVKGQFLMLEVIIQPVKNHNFYRVSLVFHNTEAEELLQELQRVRNVNQEKLSTIVKQICLYANIVGKVVKARLMKAKNVTITTSSNTIARLNVIQRLRKRTLDDLKQNDADVFSRYQFSENKLDQFGDYIK